MQGHMPRVLFHKKRTRLQETPNKSHKKTKRAKKCDSYCETPNKSHQKKKALMCVPHISAYVQGYETHVPFFFYMRH
jgi:hypothetical protein